MYTYHGKDYFNDTLKDNSRAENNNYQGWYHLLEKKKALYISYHVENERKYYQNNST